MVCASEGHTLRCLCTSVSNLGDRNRNLGYGFSLSINLSTEAEP